MTQIELILAFCAQARIPMSTLSTIAGLHRSTVSNVVSGRISLTVKMATKIAVAMRACAERIE